MVEQRLPAALLLPRQSPSMALLTSVHIGKDKDHKDKENRGGGLPERCCRPISAPPARFPAVAAPARRRLLPPLSKYPTVCSLSLSLAPLVYIDQNGRRYGFLSFLVLLSCDWQRRGKGGGEEEKLDASFKFHQFQISSLHFAPSHYLFYFIYFLKLL